MTSSIPPVQLHTALVDRFQGYFGAERVVEAIERGCSTRTTSPTSSPSMPRASTCRRRSWPGSDRNRASPACRGWEARRMEVPAADAAVLPESPPRRVRARALLIAHVCDASRSPHRRAPRLLLPHARSLRVDRSGPGDRERGVAGVGLRGLGPYLRRLDLRAAAYPDSFVANSTAVQERIRRFYGRDSVVIHPPVDVDQFSATAGERTEFLWVQRLVPHSGRRSWRGPFAGCRTG